MIIPYFVLPWTTVPVISAPTLLMGSTSPPTTTEDPPLLSVREQSEKGAGIEINLTEAELLEAGYENNKRAWSDREDALLLNLMGRKNFSWQQIAEHVPGRTSKMCYSRYRRLTCPLKSQWTQVEDTKIRELVCKYGQDWSKISQFFKKRTTKQIKDHYLNYLRPEINKGPWTFEEDVLLISLLRTHGKNWNYIEANMEGRTQYQIKNRYFRRLKILEDKKKQNKHEHTTSA